MPLEWSTRVPSFNWIRLTVPELRWQNFSIDHQYSPNFYVFWGRKGPNFNFHLSNSPKALPLRERRIMTYWALGCVQKCDLWAWRRKEKKGQKLSCVKLAICPDHSCRRSPEILHVGSCPGSSFIFQVSWISFMCLRAVGCRKLPSLIDLAHDLYNSFYYRTSCDSHIPILKRKLSLTNHAGLTGLCSGSVPSSLVT